MVVLAKGELEQIALPAAVQKAAPPLADVPEVDLGGGACRADAARAVVAACEGHGFFKVTGHGVPAGLLARVEAAAAAFFAMAQPEKEAAAAAPPPCRGARSGTGARGSAATGTSVGRVPPARRRRRRRRAIARARRGVAVAVVRLVPVSFIHSASTHCRSRLVCDL